MKQEERKWKGLFRKKKEKIPEVSEMQKTENVKGGNSYGTKQNKKSKEEKKFYKVQISLKTKVIFSVMGTITIILLTFLIFILRSYKINMTESVSNIGCAQAEQTASVYDSADGLYEKIQHFFETQKESNSFTNAPYERIDIIITDLQMENDFEPKYAGEWFIEQIKTFKNRK